MLSWFGKKDKEEVVEVQVGEEIKDLTNKDISDFFTLHQDTKLAYQFTKNIHTQFKKYKNEVDTNEQIERILLSLSAEVSVEVSAFLRYISSGQLTNNTRYFFEKMEREENDNDIQTLYKYLVYRVSSDFEGISNVFRNERREHNGHLLALATTFTTLETGWKMLNAGGRVESFRSRLVEVSPELGEVFKPTPIKEVLKT